MAALYTSQIARHGYNLPVVSGKPTSQATVERISYDAYGKARHHRMADLDGNGAVNGFDQLMLLGNWGNYGLGDLDRSGTVNGFDHLMLNSNWGGALPDGQLSHTSGSNPTDNIIGYAGYIFNAESPGANNGYLYTVRFRHYEPGLGRWITRDPLGYVDGMNLYLYGLSNPYGFIDPWGLSADDSCGKNPGVLDWLNPVNLFKSEPDAIEQKIALDYLREQGMIQHGQNPNDLINQALGESDVRQSVWEYHSAIDNAALEGAVVGLGHGAEMVANSFTLGMTPLDARVQANIENYGTSYQIANLSTQVSVELGMLATGLGMAGKVMDKGGDAAKWSQQVITRKNPGADGATSKHIIEQLGGATNSVTHQVEKGGKIIHQHQKHIGKHGTRRTFPNEWIQHPTIP